MDYVEGCTLYSQIRCRNQMLKQGHQQYFSELCEMISYLHSQSILYRDLKPENVIISMKDSGHLKLVDFGFSKHLRTKSEKTFTNCGTPSYLAPEIIQGNGHSFSVDVWGLGILLYELITLGQTPFNAQTPLLIY